MNIEWDKAPKDATHFHPMTKGYVDHWVKREGHDSYFCVTGFEKEGWKREGCRGDDADLIERPKQPQAWSGDGSPPVGTICEFNRYDGQWVRCQIKLFDADGIVIKCSGYLGSLFAKNCSLLTFGIGTVRFRAIKTDEQIAQEKRESAIRELMDIAQVDCRVTAARLVDAGFKREVV